MVHFIWQLPFGLVSMDQIHIVLSFVRYFNIKSILNRIFNLLTRAIFYGLL